MMNEEIKNFILKNKDLINQNTKESWEKIYLDLKNNDAFIGEFTYTLLEAGIDPSEVMGYIPSGFLQDSKIKSYEVPKSVNSIDYRAFQDCFNLSSIKISNTVTSIGLGVFSGCYNLTSIVIPNSVRSINFWAFEECTNLTSVTILSNDISIAEYAFHGCVNLNEIQFKGTKEDAIKCGIGDESLTKWRNNSSISRIICSDGVIEL